MNERIKQLAIKAGLGMYRNDEWSFSKNEEKLVELIVRECISVMKSTVDESIDFERKLDETSSWIESDIKRYFGVEL